MKRSELFHLFEKASTRYHLALNGWRADKPSGFKAFKKMFSGQSATAPVKGTVKVAKRVPSLVLLRDARNAAEAAYLSKKPRSLAVVNSDIARLSNKASKVEAKAAKVKKPAKVRKNRLRVMVIEDQVALLQKEIGLIAPSTPATAVSSKAGANAKASKKALKKAKKNKTKVTLHQVGTTLDMSNFPDDPRLHDWSAYLDDPNVEVAYRFFLAQAVTDNNQSDKSYWSARLFARQNPTITAQHDALDAWKTTVNVREHTLMEAREGIKAEFTLRRKVSSAANGTHAVVGARS